MGGGTHQVNNSQASTSDANATAASNQALQLSKQYGGQESQIFNTLFGNGKGGGTLSGMMNPASLNTGAPTGAYKTAWNTSQDQIAQDYKNERGSLAQSWANAGMGANNTPSGFQADQQRKLGSSEADTRGNTYTGIVGQQHADALNNFWNANNIAAGQGTAAGTGAVSGANSAGETQANLFGTAGRQKQTGTSAATGITESFCAAEGSKILMPDGTRKAVETLAKGDKVLGVDGKPDELLDDPQATVQEICEVKTRDTSAKVSLSHTFVRHAGGYSFAGKSLAQTLDTDHGPQPVLEVRMTGEKLVCFSLFLKRSHGYNVEGIWSLE